MRWNNKAKILLVQDWTMVVTTRIQRLIMTALKASDLKKRKALCLRHSKERFCALVLKGVESVFCTQKNALRLHHSKGRGCCYSYLRIFKGILQEGAEEASYLRNPEKGRSVFCNSSGKKMKVIKRLKTSNLALKTPSFEIKI